MIKLTMARTAVFMSIVIFVSSCSKTPEEKIKDAFGDTSAWTVSDWQRVENDLQIKLSKNTAERKRSLGSLSGIDFRKPENKHIAETAKELSRLLRQEEDEIRSKLSLVQYAIEKNDHQQETVKTIDVPNSKQVSAMASPAPKSNFITVGAFSVDVPADWKKFSDAESSEFKRQYNAQSEEIYRQYSGANDGSRSVDIAAFWISGYDGSFIFGCFTVPPQSDLITLLKSQAADKAAWGVREGYIRKYLGLVPIDNEQFSGFYTKTIGKNGEIQVSAGLEHKNLKNTIVQLTLLCPKTWDEVKAADTLTAILKSVTLKNK